MKHTVPLFVFIISQSIFTTAQRSPHRPHDPHLPSIIVWSSDNPHDRQRLIDGHLKPTPILQSFRHKHFEKHLVPDTGIAYGDKQITKEKINALIEHFLDEIKQKKHAYRDFIILKESGFIRQKKCGLIILKFKDYPFVFKFFIENPKSFINPYDKGFEMCNVFVAGGSFRHALGFTRIKTLSCLKKRIARDEHWRNRVSLPRKWFWLPKDPAWLHIQTHNLGPRTTDHAVMPAIYGVIADELHEDKEKETDYAELMNLSKFSEHRIDPHAKNFFIEKGTGKIALIDTELFPIIMGYTEKIDGRDSHVAWYLQLAGKYLKSKVGSYKWERYEKWRSTKNYYWSPKSESAAPFCTKVH